MDVNEEIKQPNKDNDLRSSRVSLVWFKMNDLRVTDHAPLLHAHRTSDTVLHLLVVDDFWFTRKTRLLQIAKSGVYRNKFLRESIAHLRARLEALGSQLIIRVGASADIIPRIAREHGVDTICYHDEFLSEEVAIERAVRSKFRANRVAFEPFWGGNTLLEPSDLPWDSLDALPESFTQFRKAVDGQIAVRAPSEALSQELCRPHPIVADIGDVPELDADADAVEVDARSQFPFKGGEAAAWRRLRAFLYGDADDLKGVGAVATYKETRNESIGTDYSSKLSPFLSVGALSSRSIYAELKRFEERSGVRNESTYWLYWELLCRDFFRFSAVRYGDRIFLIDGPFGKQCYAPFAADDWRWSRDRELFAKWCSGSTGYPLVDAAMRELSATGFVSNRMRQVTANFLVKDLGVDWRWGAEWFEANLIDFDAAQNYCNWCYVVGIGFDVCAARRYFNILKQAQTYDPNGDFVRLWLPCLEGVAKECVQTPWTMSAAQQRECGCVLGTHYAPPCQELKPPPSKKQCYNNKVNKVNKRKSPKRAQ